jgi:hypothetical protein
MKKPNTIEDEIDAIRRDIYEEIKDMTWDERCEYFRAKARAALPNVPFITLPSRPPSCSLVAHEDTAEYNPKSHSE